jgi:putative NADH-flavin reductase
MKIALFGASGVIGQRILAEALRRGHNVTALVRDPAKLTVHDPKLRAAAANVTDAAGVAAAVRGHDAVVSAVGPRHDGGSDTNGIFADAAHALIAGLNQAGVKRLLVLGGAGTLEVAPGVRVVDTPEFPAAWKGNALGQADALNILRTEGGGLDWTYISPAAMIAPGERTGTYRIGGDQILTDAQGESHISAEDYAVALLDELETPAHVKQRITVAY